MESHMDLTCFNWIQIIKKSDLPSNAKLVCFYLSTFMNAEHDCAWPSQIRIATETGLARSTVIKWIDYLSDNKWLIKRSQVRSVPTSGGMQMQNEYLINIPDKVVRETVSLIEGCPTVEQRVSVQQQKVDRQSDTNNNVNNNSNNNKDKSANKFTDDDSRSADYMWDKINDLNFGDKKPNLDKWADTIRLMRERDNRGINEILELFNWANSDDFWSSNIRSPAKLREKWAQLTGQMKRGNGNGENRKVGTAERVHNKLKELYIAADEREQNT